MWTDQDESEQPFQHVSFTSATVAAANYLRPTGTPQSVPSLPPPGTNSPPVLPSPPPTRQLKSPLRGGVPTFVIAPGGAAATPNDEPSSSSSEGPGAPCTRFLDLDMDCSPRRASQSLQRDHMLPSHSSFIGCCDSPLVPVTEADLGFSSAELSAVFTAQPPPVLQPEHANRIRKRQGSESEGKRERERRERRQREQGRIAEGARSVRPGYVELFLRCFQGQRIDQAALCDLREFIFSVAPETAEANQQAAADIYLRELKAAVAARRGKKAAAVKPLPHEPRGAAMDSLRAFVAARVAEPGGSLSKEKEKDLYGLSVFPRHFLVDPVTAETKGGRLSGELQVKNNGHRGLRWWLHDPELYAR
eukprot:Hpha_TRINITY_DN3159_c0_g1::TRINITY_DN3159_c0_g1_i1::g.96617::m.96617